MLGVSIDDASRIIKRFLADDEFEESWSLYLFNWNDRIIEGAADRRHSGMICSHYWGNRGAHRVHQDSWPSVARTSYETSTWPMSRWS